MCSRAWAVVCIQCGVWCAHTGHSQIEDQAVSRLHLVSVALPVLDALSRGGGGTPRVSFLSLKNDVLCLTASRDAVPSRGPSIWTEEPLAEDLLALSAPGLPWGTARRGPGLLWIRTSGDTTRTVTDTGTLRAGGSTATGT